jgi:hypothetical protein
MRTRTASLRKGKEKPLYQFRKSNAERECRLFWPNEANAGKLTEFNASHPECIARDEQRASCNAYSREAGKDAKPFIEGAMPGHFWPNEANPGNLS